MASEDFRGSAYGRRTADVWLSLVSISHDSFDATFRLVGNGEPVDRGAIRYQPFSLRLRLPRDTDDGGLDGDIEIEDIDRELIPALRAATDPPAVSVVVVRASDPATAEFEYPSLELKDLSIDGLRIRAIIGVRDYRTEPIPAYSITPADFPGAF